MPGMFRGKSRGGSSGYRGGARGGSATGQLRGLFEKGTWKCDCTPREPAAHFPVKKESPNKGRWFFVCQKPDPQRCGFFLWDEDAKPRMEAAVLSNSTSEPVAGQQAQQQSTHNHNTRSAVSPPPPYNATATDKGKNPLKRRLPWLEEDDDDDDDDDMAGVGPSQPRHAAGAQGNRETDNRWGISPEEERSLQHLSDQPSPFVTPRKAQKHSTYDTPSKAHGLPTPDTTPSKTGAHSPLSPSKTKSASLLASTLETLEAHHVKVSTALVDDLDALFSVHDRQTQGVVKGRQIARLAVQARDEQIVELAQRISLLEGQVESGRAVARHLRDELESVKRK